MMGSSQQAGWYKKPTSPTNARATLEVVRKTMDSIVLLTVAALTGTTGTSDVSAMVGNSSVLTCSPKSNITMVTWKISPKVGGPCTLSYRADQNKTNRTNCSDSVDWKFRPDRDPSLEIRQVEIAHEGNYTCEVVATEGNFHKMYQLTVLVPPRLTLYCDDNGIPVCKAAVGKPAAQILWVLEGISTPKEEGHDNGTVTVLSNFTAYSTNTTNTTCIVSHPAGNQSSSIACHPPREEEISTSQAIFHLQSCLGLFLTQHLSRDERNSQCASVSNVTCSRDSRVPKCSGERSKHIQCSQCNCAEIIIDAVIIHASIKLF
ncbi:LOW QUALITY PROTEIN: cell surface glycoprotein CD200 receptor 1-B-like [Tyto alba]|uniref:LOW QUALITY PROTEIN: cell surface glycoprotein CD200 receptor 1-B-like n=1 Tax=Tyto alba TaxID=56313 RepID=UPI001C6724F6|nr:LOW QUALITY PROTEIN: cell surface glycoprotein CD200 receptor 1-B-like [Tyto alba]